MDEPSSVFHYATSGGLGLILLKQTWDFFLARKAKDEDETSDRLKAMEGKLDTIVTLLHAQDKAGVLLEARVENLEREVVDLRKQKHEQASTMSAHKARLDLIEERLRELREDTNPGRHR